MKKRNIDGLFVFFSAMAVILFGSCENPYVQEIMRAPVYLQQIEVMAALPDSDPVPCVITPGFVQEKTGYTVIVPDLTTGISLNAAADNGEVRFSADGRPSDGTETYPGVNIFTITTSHEYMDETTYTLNVVRDKASAYIYDLQVLTDVPPNGLECRLGNFNLLMTEYNAEIPADLTAIYVKVKPQEEVTLSYEYVWDDGATASLTVTPLEGFDPDYTVLRLAYPARSGSKDIKNLIITTDGGDEKAPKVYTVHITRQKSVSQIAGLEISIASGPGNVTYPVAPVATPTVPDNPFDPSKLDYAAEVSEDADGEVQVTISTFNPGDAITSVVIYAGDAVVTPVYISPDKKTLRFTRSMPGYVLGIQVQDHLGPELKDPGYYTLEPVQNLLIIRNLGAFAA
ncbi:MAG: cadherin-like beta sandwich domain-containing protein [Spirochaetales bacterium]|jgi:hypothetical protein|nr:cadherin-like beta sandwich domain-containing protein [Spirochaetales bacterium]